MKWLESEGLLVSDRYAGERICDSRLFYELNMNGHNLGSYIFSRESNQCKKNIKAPFKGCCGNCYIQAYYDYNHELHTIFT